MEGERFGLVWSGGAGWDGMGVVYVMSVGCGIGLGCAGASRNWLGRGDMVFLSSRLYAVDGCDANNTDRERESEKRQRNDKGTIDQ